MTSDDLIFPFIGTYLAGTVCVIGRVPGARQTTMTVSVMFTSRLDKIPYMNAFLMLVPHYLLYSKASMTPLKTQQESPSAWPQEAYCPWGNITCCPVRTPPPVLAGEDPLTHSSPNVIM